MKLIDRIQKAEQRQALTNTVIVMVKPCESEAQALKRYDTTGKDIIIVSEIGFATLGYRRVSRHANHT